MRRVAICCVLSLLMVAAVGRAAPLGPHRVASARPGGGGGTVLLGDRKVERVVGRTRAGRAEAFPFAAHRAGKVSAIRVYVDAHNKARKLIVGLYSSRSGNPVRRVASGTLSSPKAGAWNTVSVTRATVRASSTYWIAVLGRGGTLYLRHHKNGSCQGETYLKSHVASLPRSWDRGTRLNACPISAYATGHPTTSGIIGPPTGPTSPPGTSGVPAAQVGAPTPAGVSCTQALNPGANVGSALSSASAGSVVCLNSGSWPAITLSGIAPASPGVTLAATPGQTVVVPGFTVTGSSTRNLTIEGFNITQPGNLGNPAGGNTSVGIQLLCGISGGVTVAYNTIEDQPKGDGVYTYANSCGGGGHTQNGVTIEYNQIDHVATGMEIDGGISEELNFVVSHNVIGPYLQDGSDGHYIQVQGISGLTMNNNAFEGPPDPSYQNCAANGSASHLNVVHVDTGETNFTFDNNILWHTGACGQSVLIQDTPLDNIAMVNNLDVEDPSCGPAPSCESTFALVEAPHGFAFEHNTIVNALRGTTLGYTTGGTYTDPNGMTGEYNIAAGHAEVGEQDYDSWKCSSSCTTGYNTSQDSSATSVFGGSGNVVNWTPTWTTTSWTPVSGPGYRASPAGYYQPASLSIANAGYQGHIGP